MIFSDLPSLEMQRKTRLVRAK